MKSWAAALAMPSQFEAYIEKALKGVCALATQCCPTLLQGDLVGVEWGCHMGWEVANGNRSGCRRLQVHIRRNIVVASVG